MDDDFCPVSRAGDDRLWRRTPQGHSELWLLRRTEHRKASSGPLDDVARFEVSQGTTELQRLGANPIFDCQLDVRAKRILGTVPYSWSFAMRNLPNGQRMHVPPALGQLMAEMNLHPDKCDVDELERLLMQTLRTYPDADRGLRRTAIPPPVRK